MKCHSPKIKVCHVAMGDLWAGAEVQLAILLSSLIKEPDLAVTAVLFNEGRLASELIGLGIKTHVIPESRHNPFSIAKQLSDFFRDHQVDILHTHKYKDNILGFLSTSRQGIPFRVRTIHGLPEPYNGIRALKNTLYHTIDSAVNRWLVDRILAVSLDLKSQLIQRYGNNKVVCIHNAIDVESVRPSGCAADLRKQLNLDEHEFLIGTMCRLTRVKGLEFFLEAARIVRSQRSDVRFIIVGDGPLKSSLQALACEYGLEKDVLFLGHRDDSHELLELLDIFVLSSLSEGMPMVLLEALALARPVVATRVGGIPEVIEHGISGLLVTPGRGDEFAEECIALMDNYNYAQRLGESGRKRVEENFSARVMAERVAEVYRSLVWREGPR